MPDIHYYSKSCRKHLCQIYWGYTYLRHIMNEQDCSSYIIWKKLNLAIHIEEDFGSIKCKLLPIYFDFLRVSKSNYQYLALGYTAWLDKIYNIEKFSFIAGYSLETANVSITEYRSEIKCIIPDFLAVIIDENGNYRMSNGFKLWLLWIAHLWIMFKRSGNYLLISYLCDKITRDRRIFFELKLQIRRMITKLEDLLNGIFWHLPCEPSQIAVLFSLCTVNFEHFHALVKGCGINFNIVIIVTEKLILSTILNDIFHQDISSVILDFLPKMQLQCIR